jgi:bifunctional enzyme CysN/CysC
MKQESSIVTSGVIWLSGFSAAGKTSVARNLVSKLRANGVKTIHLDGDDLRAIFGENFGFERADRIELARAYFRLCSHLSAQGNTVVISAVAMYQEVREWVRTYVPSALEVHLDVTNAERRRRDKNLKNIYTSNSNLESIYDKPDAATFVVNNQGDRSIEVVSQDIYDHYLNRKNSTFDLGRDSHWSKFYAANVASTDPSPFALSVFSQLDGSEKILEIGCGNGRDAEYFGGQGFSVVAMDSSIVAINNCKSQFLETKVNYVHGVGGGIVAREHINFDVAYCRFVIHAMPLAEECELHKNVFNSLSSGGKYFIECRSINDPMAYKGEIISGTERINGHYRRFIVLDDLLNRLSYAGFEVESSMESMDLAAFGAENPMVIRITASKK